MTDVPTPAATVIVFRDRPSGPPELLIVERAKVMSFAGGMLVFPGGRVDAGDRALATTLGGDPDDLAARIAAVRECIEEAGLPVALDAVPDAATLARLRAALHDGAAIGDALAEAGRAIDPAALTPFARWLPQMVPHRIFDTRFYLARLPDGAAEPTVDATENTRLFWASAADVLAMCDRGEAQVIFPTRRNLERLAQFDSHADAVAHAHAYPVRTITPWLSGEGADERLNIPADAGYPVTSEPTSSALRA